MVPEHDQLGPGVGSHPGPAPGTGASAHLSWGQETGLAFAGSERAEQAKWGDKAESVKLFAENR